MFASSFSHTHSGTAIPLSSIVISRIGQSRHHTAAQYVERSVNVIQSLQNPTVVAHNRSCFPNPAIHRPGCILNGRSDCEAMTAETELRTDASVRPMTFTFVICNRKELIPGRRLNARKILSKKLNGNMSCVIPAVCLKS